MFTANKLRRFLVLLAIFIGCFSIAIWLVTKFVAGTDIQGSLADKSSSILKGEHFLPKSVSINKEGRYLSVDHNADFIPIKKQDYLLFFWVNLKNLPDIGERLVLLSKYRGTPPKIQGFALALKRDINSMRPVLFWGDGSSAGRWYDFPEISLVPNEWNLFALHVHKERFVGMYSARVLKGADPTVRFLGGHEIMLDNPLDLGTAEIVFGAPEGREFRGRLGPLAIINPLSIDFENLIETLESYVKSPLDFSLLASSSEYKLLIEDGRKDSSEKANAVVVNY